MKDAASPDRFQGVNGQHYEKGLADVVQTEAVGADQGLGLIPPNRATNGQKAGLQGGKDQLEAVERAPQVVKMVLAEAGFDQTTPGAVAVGLTGPSPGAKAAPRQSASYHYQKDSLSTHELDLKTHKDLALRCLNSAKRKRKGS